MSLKILPDAIATIAVRTDRGERIVIASSEEIARAQRLAGVKAIGPDFVEVLANVNRIFPGARVVKLNLPRLGLSEGD